MKIYTKTGDLGKTSLYGGKRVLKNDIRVETYGTIDELNSLVGIAVLKNKDERIRNFLISVQKDLFIIGSFLAGSNVELDILSLRIGEMEKLIDSLDGKLPKLGNFILPGGMEGAAFLFLLRAVTRRAERNVVMLSIEEMVVNSVIVYLNRLSDLLFVFARYVNYKAGNKETIWKG
jgi:cob(I)alamin adenosyltransferase